MKLNKIFSERRLEILFEIYSSKKDYMRNLSAKLNINSSLCHRILKSLCKANVISREKQGKEIFYNLTKDSELFIPLLEEFNLERRTAGSNKLFNLIKLIRENKSLLSLCKRIYVFGSYATGTQKKESDIDLLFVSDHKKELSKEVRELSILLNKQVNAIVYSEREFEEKLTNKDPLVYSIASNPGERLVVK